MRILIVDDDTEIRKALTEYFASHGFQASAVADGRQMDRVLAESSVDLIVLDIMMPGEDGLDICRRLQATSAVPVILLTARTEETDRIIGLELGADDYLSKPFNPRELVARIKSVLRRSQMLPRRQVRTRGVVRFDRWRFDLLRKELLDSDQVVIRLSTGEHALLVALIEHAGVVLSRDQLLDLTKGREAQPFDRSVDNQISRLRRKLEEDPKHPRIIVTEWGGGYVFTAYVEWAS